MYLSSPESQHARRQTPQSQTSSPGSRCWWCRVDWSQPSAKEKCSKKFVYISFITLHTFTWNFWKALLLMMAATVMMNSYVVSSPNSTTIPWHPNWQYQHLMVDNGRGFIENFRCLLKWLNSRRRSLSFDVCNVRGLCNRCAQNVKESRTELFGIKETLLRTQKWK